MDRATKIKLKLARVFKKLGTGFAEGFDLVKVTDKIPTACWGINKLGHEFVYINPGLCLMLNVSEITQVMRHEFLHRSFYSGFSEKFKNHVLSNVVLDVTVNKILYLADPEAMRGLSSKIYPPESHSTIVALANCCAVQEKMDSKLQALYSKIWNNDRIPNPSSLYYKLLKYLTAAGYSQKQIENSSPWGKPIFSGFPEEDGPRQKDPLQDGTEQKDTRQDESGQERAEKEEPIEDRSKILGGDGTLARKGRDTLDDIWGGAGSKPGGLDDVISKYGDPRLKKSRDEIDDFIGRQRFLGELTRAANRLESALIPGSRIQPFPMELSRLGISYMVTGISDVLKIYFNRPRETFNVRVAVYVDSSGSMYGYLPSVLWILDQLDRIDMDFYYFDVDVYSSSRDDLANRRVLGGGGTDFSAPVNHFALAGAELSSAIIFTDGFAEISDTAVENLLLSGKELYTVFFNCSDYEDNILTELSRDAVNVKI